MASTLRGKVMGAFPNKGFWTISVKLTPYHYEVLILKKSDCIFMPGDRIEATYEPEYNHGTLLNVVTSITLLEEPVAILELSLYELGIIKQSLNHLHDFLLSDMVIKVYNEVDINVELIDKQERVIQKLINKTNKVEL